jgi:mercuric ion transport protein
MKAAWVSVVTALSASVCCTGPVVAVTAGGSALTAVAVRCEPFRPMFLTLTVALLGFAFYRVYRLPAAECAADVACLPSVIYKHNRRRRRSAP